MVLGKLPVPGRPTIWITVRQGPTALVVGAGGGVWTFLLSSILFSPLSPSLWETARYRLKYCLKGPLNPKQPTNQILSLPAAQGGILLIDKKKFAFYCTHFSYLSLHGSKLLHRVHLLNVQRVGSTFPENNRPSPSGPAKTKGCLVPLRKGYK